MPESNSIGVQVNPYQPPQSPNGKGELIVSLRGRIFIAGIASICVLLFVVVFHDTVSMAVTLGTVFATATALGLMPHGYGKHDWLFGVWIILLGGAFGLAVWWRKLGIMHPLDRGHLLIIHLAFLGLAPGIAASLPYAAARAFSKRVFEAQGFRSILTSEDGRSDQKVKSSLDLNDPSNDNANGKTKSSTSLHH